MEHLPNPTPEQLARLAAAQNVNTNGNPKVAQAVRIDHFFRRFGEIVSDCTKEIAESPDARSDINRLVGLCQMYLQQHLPGKKV